ncbi:AAA family ATPase [Enterococcus faecalis]|uniref:AAA family ATPase n=1 Tax=Enterococcus faecalis TaxID=1351 RepID=UPI0038D10376
MKSKLWEVGKELLTVFELVKDNDIIITGSNANMLSGELATLLSGRYIEFPIYPLSF